MPRTPHRGLTAADAAGPLALPHAYTPRAYQRPFWTHMLEGGPQARGGRYAVLVWHRRAGKDTTAWNWMLYAACQRVGTYFYLFPTYAQGKKILWDGRNREGMRFLAHCPAGLIANVNESELRVELKNGSACQIIGVDHVDTVRGTNPAGCVFSEYATQNPTAWHVIDPILTENKGWAVFAYTPNGRNHGYDLFRRAEARVAAGDRDWFVQRLTVEDTDVFAPAEIAAKRGAGEDEQFLQQEYYCSFSGAVLGSYYATELDRARAEGRIGAVPYLPTIPVETACDLGHQDPTAVWFYQQVGYKVHLIDYYEATRMDLLQLAKVFAEKPYLYRTGEPHLAPHDIRKTEFGDGRTVFDKALQLGLRFRVVPKMSPLERIAAARVLFPRLYFNAGPCERGIEALYQYHKEFDESAQTFKLQPKHDWASHGADAFGHLAVGLQAPDVAPLQVQAQTWFDPFRDERRLQPATVRVEQDFDPFGRAA